MSLSLWEKESFYAPADIIIIGSGFVGLWSAYYLKKKHPRLRITIVERGIIPSGASTRNAGFACFGSVTELIKDAAMMGEEQMLWLVEMRYRGLAKIRKTFKKKQIDYEKSGGYEMVPALNDRMNELEWQVKWLNSKLNAVLKEKKVFRFSDEKIGEFGFSEVGHIIENELEGTLHPGKLCMSLLHLVQEKGVVVLSGIDVDRFEESANGIKVFAKNGLELSADQLLICTNGFSASLMPGFEITPARGQVLVTSEVPSLKLKGAFHYNEGFYYFRNVGNRLLIGGARNIAIEQETTTEMTVTEDIQTTLEQFVSKHILPGTYFEVTDRWSGIMGVGPEKMPVIKKVSPNVFCAVRMSGIGVALAPVAADTITDLMR
ncbi:MAG: FAD-binding oxidoreductase [Chitinophagaceae bacterium]|nr:FAD-binding oxidoreductase [Chitinophagaceae bacterium]